MQKETNPLQDSVDMILRKDRQFITTQYLAEEIVGYF